MATDKNINMAFICNQDWDAMAPTEHGKYCTICKKEVFDYTSKNLREIHQSINKQTNKSDLCGRFDIEQVDTTLIKPIEVPRSVKLFTFLSTFFLSISTKTSYSQVTDTTKIERVEIKKGDSTPRTITKQDSIPKTKETPKINPKKHIYLKSKNGRYYYWSRKFPFIKIIKRNRLRPLVGKVYYFPTSNETPKKP